MTSTGTFLNLYAPFSSGSERPSTFAERLGFNYFYVGYENWYGVPLWLFSALIAIAMITLIYLRHKAVTDMKLGLRVLHRELRASDSKQGSCSTCFYNLTANTSGVCPECGTPVPSGPKVVA